MTDNNKLEHDGFQRIPKKLIKQSKQNVELHVVTRANRFLKHFIVILGKKSTYFNYWSLIDSQRRTHRKRICYG